MLVVSSTVLDLVSIKSGKVLGIGKTIPYRCRQEFEGLQSWLVVVSRIPLVAGAKA